MKKRGVSVERQEAAEESEALEEEAKSGTEARADINPINPMCFVLPSLMKDHYQLTIASFLLLEVKLSMDNPTVAECCESNPTGHHVQVWRAL